MQTQIANQKPANTQETEIVCTFDPARQCRRMHEGFNPPHCITFKTCTDKQRCVNG